MSAFSACSNSTPNSTPFSLHPQSPTQRLLATLTAHWQSIQNVSTQTQLPATDLHILSTQLQQQGVPLHLGSCGIRLEAGTPAPQLVCAAGPLGQQHIYVGTIDSTQDSLKRWASSDQTVPHGTLLVAEHQSAGRGRQGRVWHTQNGMLAFSLLFRDPDPLHLPFWPLAVGVALRQTCGLGQLKWPNDLLVNGRKLAGLLLEADIRGQHITQAVLGVGLNVHAAPEQAAYLREFRSVQRATLLSDFLSALREWLSRSPAEIRHAWLEHALLRVPMSVHTAQHRLSGQALGIDENGALKFQTDDGQNHTIHAGDVQML